MSNQIEKWLMEADKHFSGYDCDYSKALPLYKKAAEAGNAEGQYKLGKIYASGDEDNDLEDDQEKAVYWYLKAAEQGHVDAQISVSVHYENGNGTAQSYEKTLYWTKKAFALHGGSGIKATIERLKNEIAKNGGAIKKETLSKTAQEKQKQIHESAVNMIEYYYGENGKQQDYSKAIYWAKKGVELGDAECIGTYGMMLLQGHGVKQNKEEGLRTMRKAAKLGDKGSQRFLEDSGL